MTSFQYGLCWRRQERWRKTKLNTNIPVFFYSRSWCSIFSSACLVTFFQRSAFQWPCSDVCLGKPSLSVSLILASSRFQSVSAVGTGIEAKTYHSRHEGGLFGAWKDTFHVKIPGSFDPHTADQETKSRMAKVFLSLYMAIRKPHVTFASPRSVLRWPSSLKESILR